MRYKAPDFDEKSILNSEEKLKKLAELVGLVLGDGYIHISDNRICVSGSLGDIHYYKNHVSFLFKDLFNKSPNIYKVNNKNSYLLQMENKYIFEFLISKIGMLRGSKKGRAKVPSFLVKNPKLFPHILRGLFDTDGSLKFSKQNKKYLYYPRVRISASMSPIVDQIKYFLDQLDFNFSFHKDHKDINNEVYVFEISGKENLHKWMEIIGSSNPVHYTKYLVWKKFGYYDKFWCLDTRFNLLNSK